MVKKNYGPMVLWSKKPIVLWISGLKNYSPMDLWSKNYSPMDLWSKVGKLKTKKI